MRLRKRPRISRRGVFYVAQLVRAAEEGRGFEPLHRNDFNKILTKKSFGETDNGCIFEYRKVTNKLNAMNNLKDVLSKLRNKGFDINQSLNIVKRINKHLSYCIDNNQDYEETIFFVAQDFTFERPFLEPILIDIMLATKEYEDYFCKMLEI